MTYFHKNNVLIIISQVNIMQYFMALKAGQKRVNDSREYLNKFANGKAMPALALKTTKQTSWSQLGKKICIQL